MSSAAWNEFVLPLGAEIIRVLSAEAKASLERKGQRGYVDAMNESGLE